MRGIETERRRRRDAEARSPDGGRKSSTQPVPGGVQRPGGCAGENERVQPTKTSRAVAPMAMPRTRVIQLAAGVRKRAKRVSRSNRRVRGGRSASAGPRVGVKGPEFLAWVLVLFDTSWAMVKMVLHRIETDAGGAELDPVSASRSGRALILVVRRRESRARSQANGPGRGWTLQFSGLETLEKARQRIQLFTNP